jgi:hypothetical protein
VKKQLLQNNDTVEIGKYKIKYVNEAASAGFEKTMVIKAGMGRPGCCSSPVAASRPPALPRSCSCQPPQRVRGQWQHQGAVRVRPPGREVPLVKVVTTIGKPGVAVAAITKRSARFCRGTTWRAPTSLRSTVRPSAPSRSP